MYVWRFTMQKFEKRLDALRKEIPQISVKQAQEMQQQGAVIIDVRTEAEYLQSHAKGAIHLGRDFLEFKIDKHVSDDSKVLMIMCGGGQRSLFAAESLRELGYEVKNIEGGFRLWHENGLPVTV